MEESLNPQSIQEDQATSMVKTTKVLLMNPPFSLEKRYGKSIAKIGAVLLPLGLGYVAAVIERAGYPIKILDCEAENLDGEDVLQYCIKEKFDAIGVYCNTSNFNTTLTLCRQIKAALPGIKIITGGPQATNEKTATLQNDVFDFIVFGEAEETFVEILDSIEHKWDDNKKRSILGSGFKLHDTKEVIVNPSRPFIKDLDTLPFPARHLFKQDIYNPAPNQFKKLPYGSIMASRGCPYTCTFCNIVSIWKQEYRIRSPDNVISEMKHLKDTYDVKDIGFWDDIFGLSKKWLREFCTKLIDADLNIVWSCLIRVDLVDREILHLMKKAGCWMIFYGCESLDNEILQALDKKTTAEMNLQAIRLTKEAGIEVRANMIVGCPTETPEKVKKVVKLFCKEDPDYIKFDVMTPYPSTRIYDQIKEGKWGRMVESDRERFTNSTAIFVPFGYKDAREVEKMRRYAFTRFYFRPGYLIKKVFSIRSMNDVRRYYDGFGTIKNLALELVKLNFSRPQTALKTAKA